MARFPADTICCLLFAMVPVWGYECDRSLDLRADYSRMTEINVPFLDAADAPYARCDGYCRGQLGGGWESINHWWQAWRAGSSEGGSFCQCVPLCAGGGGSGLGHLPVPVPSRKPVPLSDDMTMSFFGNGCCRYDGRRAVAKGYQSLRECERLCLKDNRCIAMDVARPSSKWVGLYDCHLLFGSGKNFVTGCGKKPEEACYRVAADDWIRVYSDVGNDLHDETTDVWTEALKLSSHKMIYRRCRSCTATHRDIYYRRITDWGTIDKRDLFVGTWSSASNRLNQDFKLYSSYGDAVNDVNAWTYCNYDDVNVGFPRDCGRSGHTTWQWNADRRVDGKKVEFYIENDRPVVQKRGNKYGASAGYCRTRSGGLGTYTVHRDTTTSSCMALCDADRECVAYEFNRGYCEIHTTAITWGTGSPSYVNCFMKK